MLCGPFHPYPASEVSMSKYRAAIVAGPRGPFAVVELTEGQQRQMSPDAREQVARCFKERHRNLPVVFVTASPSTLHAMHGVDVSDDLERCLDAERPDLLPWMYFDAQSAMHPPG
jgi:nitrate reductase cytochrome c-type subunit